MATMQAKRLRVRLDPDVGKIIRQKAKTNFRSISKEASQQLRTHFENLKTPVNSTCTS